MELSPYERALFVEVVEYAINKFDRRTTMRPFNAFLLSTNIAMFCTFSKEIKHVLIFLMFEFPTFELICEWPSLKTLLKRH